MIKAGKIDGVYFDQGAANECANALHGCGYMESGVRHATHARFISDRDGGIFPTPASPDIQTGLYVNPGGDAVLAVGNRGAAPAEVVVRIAPDILNLSGMFVADEFDCLRVEQKSQTIQCEVGGRDFRLIHLHPKKFLK
jgi:hypothetical protein